MFSEKFLKLIVAVQIALKRNQMSLWHVVKRSKTLIFKKLLHVQKQVRFLGDFPYTVEVVANLVSP